MKKIYLYIILTLVFCNAGFAEKDLVIKPNQTQMVGNHDLKFLGVKPISGPNFTGIEGLFELRQRDSKKINLLSPQKRKYIRSDDLMTEASIIATSNFFPSFLN